MRLSAVTDPPSSLWNDIIHMYTRAALTFSSDKLVALQGIAQRISEKVKSRHNLRETITERARFEYVAGIWQDEHFLQNLLWRAKLGTSRRRPEKYRAPSWSWASIDGPILAFEEFVFWAWNREKNELATIKDVRIEPLPSHTASLTGQVIGGHIDMECHVRPCYVKSTSESTTRHSNANGSDAIIISRTSGTKLLERDLAKRATFTMVNDDVMRRFSDYCTLDCPEEISSSTWTKVYCVPLQLSSIETDRYEQAMWESYEGLVLHPIGDEHRLSANESVILDGEQKCAKSRLTTAADSHRMASTSSPLQTFRRIGIFAFHIHNSDRESQYDELFGPVTNNNLRIPSREKECIRII